jgi:hypothetical protein
MPGPRSTAEQLTREDLLRLVYELLDAHDDTARLAAGLEEQDLRWRILLDYLRDLQRVGREMLARATAESDLTPEDLALDAARAAIQRAVAAPGITVHPSLRPPRRTG